MSTFANSQGNTTARTCVQHMRLHLGFSNMYCYFYFFLFLANCLPQLLLPPFSFSPSSCPNLPLIMSPRCPQRQPEQAGILCGVEIRQLGKKLEQEDNIAKGNKDDFPRFVRLIGESLCSHSAFPSLAGKPHRRYTQYRPCTKS